MGRILTIRLSAVTYKDEDVFRTWPLLCSLAWPGQGETRAGVWCPTVSASAFAGPVPPEKRARGVPELARDLLEEARFGDWETGLKDRLKQELADLEDTLSALDKALEDWQPQAANKATDSLEDILDKLEKIVAQYQA